MRQGMLALLLLSSSLTLGSSHAYAISMPASEAQHWLESQQLDSKVDELYQYILLDEVDRVSFSLQRLTLPQQEVVRFKLLQKIEQQNLALTVKVALFVESQASITPNYRVTKQGDGYQVSQLAFDYSTVANRLLRRWKEDKTQFAFLLDAEKQRLDLRKWLTEGKAVEQQHQSMLMKDIAHLSQPAVQALSQQVTQTNVTSWLPSTTVMVGLARYSKDPQAYRMLWRMRSDQNIRSELDRLIQQADDFSLQQVMAATENPNLKGLALTGLTQIKPLPSDVKEFLITRMAISEEAPLVAQALVRQGHKGWLQELISSNAKVLVPELQKVLAQSF